jgi:hypothetical protein
MKSVKYSVGNRSQNDPDGGDKNDTQKSPASR